MVGANGFEPSTSWPCTRQLNLINALYGVAYGTSNVISPLLVVPNLYLASGNWFEARTKIRAIRSLLRSFQFWRAPGWAERKADISRGTILVR